MCFCTMTMSDHQPTTSAPSITQMVPLDPQPPPPPPLPSSPHISINHSGLFPLEQIPEGNSLPEASYSAFSEKLRKTTPSDFQCALFCGGKKCKYESAKKWGVGDMAIPGIYSHWVTDDIIAMSRPNMESIERFETIKVFKEFGIKTIINLQEPWEHSSCGNPLTPSGFSYEPNVFMDNDIYFYNFQWRDYTAGENQALLDMVKVICFSLTEGKVAVHCHAGLGRTGVLISCYLIYSLRCKAQDAISYVRSRRPYAVQMKSQIESVYGFARMVVPLFIIYPSVATTGSSQNPVPLFPLEHFLKRQRVLLHGYEARHLRYIPKIIFVICERILHLGRKNKTPSYGKPSRITATTTSVQSTDPDMMVTLIDFQLTASEPFTNYFFSSLQTRESVSYSNVSSSMNHSSVGPDGVSSSLSQAQTTRAASSQESQDTISTELTGRLSREGTADSMGSKGPRDEENSSIASLSSSVNLLNDLTPIETDFPELRMDSGDSSRYSKGDRGDSPDSLNSMIEQTMGIRIHTISSPPLVFNKQEEEMRERGEGTVSTSSSGSSLRDHQGTMQFLSKMKIPKESPPIDIVKAIKELEDEMALSKSAEYDALPLKNIYKGLLSEKESEMSQFSLYLFKYKRELNINRLSWERMNRETNLELLSSLLWSWIEGLSQPIVNTSTIVYLVLKAEVPMAALAKMEDGARHTIEYVVRFIGRLDLGQIEEDMLVKRAICALSQQTIKMNESGEVIPKNRPHWREMRKGTTGRIILFFTRLLYQVKTGKPPPPNQST